MVVKKNIYVYFKSHYFLSESCDLFNKCEKLYKLSHSKLEDENTILVPTFWTVNLVPTIVNLQLIWFLPLTH